MGRWSPMSVSPPGHGARSSWCVALVVPVIANGLRAFGTIYAAYLTSVERATGLDHIVYGWVFFGLVMAAVIAIGWRWFDRAPDAPVFDPARLQKEPVRRVDALLAAALVMMTASVFPGWSAAIAGRAQTLPDVIVLPQVAGWHRTSMSVRAPWSPNYPGADHFLIGRYENRQGDAVDLAIIVYGSQHEGKELVSFGVGALRQDDIWVRIGDLPDLAGGSAMRVTAPGPVERLIATWYRVGDALTHDDTIVKIADAEGQAVRWSATRGGGACLGRGRCRGAIRARRWSVSCSALGPIDALADRSAGLSPLMCGIAGIFYPATPKPVDPSRIAAMADAQAHRGPDGSGVWTAPGVGLGHRRLSIIDVAGSPQPMASADGALTVTYNGEIYNFAELRTELAGDGRAFRHQWRHRSAAPWLGRLGTGDARSAERHVRLRAPRCPPPMPVHGARPAGREAASLCRIVGRRRSPSHPSSRGCSRTRCSGANPISARSRTIWRSAMCPTTHAWSPVSEKLPAGHAMLIERGKPVPAPSRWWDVDFSRRAQRFGQGARGRTDRSAARRGQVPHGRRCAARRIPVGRRRQFRGRRADGRGFASAP